MPHAPLNDVLIDDETWRCATRARRREWKQTIAELVDEAIFSAETGGPLRAYVTLHKAGIAVALHDPGGHEVGRLELPQGVIAPVFQEYMGIVRELVKSGRGVRSPEFEALDIAKRLTHDDAAEILQRHFRDVQPDLTTARRLFTLLVVLTYDTTKLGHG